MFYLKVRKDKGEKIRQELLKEKILNKEYKIVRDENFLYFPIQEEIEISHCEVVEREGKEVKREKRKDLPELLKGKLSGEEIELLPSSFDVVGDILILELDGRLENKKKEIGRAFLKLHKNVKVILRKSSERKGEFRTRKYEFLAGEKRIETIHKEYGCLFKLDIKKVYFSPRESRERQRVANGVKKGEKILVMFSGVGPFAIQIAKLQNCKITCVEKNPDAWKYAKDNIRLNKVGDKVENILGDMKEVGKEFSGKGENFDRILMPLPKGAHQFLDVALSLLKEQGVLHFYHWSEEEDLFSEAEELVKEAAEKLGRKIKILERKKVLPYAPRTWKIVLDVRVI